MQRHISHILTLVLITGVLGAIWSFQYVSPAEWGGYFKAQLVGQSASVEENPMNRLAQELRTKEQQLEDREIELSNKEEYLLEEIKEEQERRNMYLIGALIVVVIMMFMNFVLDWKRGEREEGLIRSALNKINNKE